MNLNKNAFNVGSLTVLMTDLQRQKWNCGSLEESDMQSIVVCVPCTDMEHGGLPYHEELPIRKATEKWPDLQEYLEQEAT